MPLSLATPVRRHGELEAGVHDRRGDRIVAAAGAERRHRPFVVAPGEAERVGRDRGMPELRLALEGHDTASRITARLRGFEARGDGVGDEARRDRRAAVVQDGVELRRVEREIARHQRAHLRVAVLLDDEHAVVGAHEVGDRGARAGRRGCAARRHGCPASASSASASSMAARGRAVVDDADRRRRGRGFDDRPRRELARRLELERQPLHVVDVGRRVLGVAGVAVAAGAAGEIGAERRMRARQRAVGHAVAVDVLVAAELDELLELRSSSAPCRGRRPAARPTGTARSGASSCRCRGRA